MVSIYHTKCFSKMTEKQTKIIDFIKSSISGKRYLFEFEKIIEVKYNQRYEWQIRGSVLAKMVKKGLIKSRFDSGKGYNRTTIYYYL